MHPKQEYRLGSGSSDRFTYKSDHISCISGMLKIAAPTWLWFSRQQNSIQTNANPSIPGCVGIAITWTLVLCSVAVVFYFFYSVRCLLKHGSSTLQNAANWCSAENAIMYHTKYILHKSYHAQNSYLVLADPLRAVRSGAASRPWSVFIFRVVFVGTALISLAFSPCHWNRIKTNLPQRTPLRNW